MLRDNGLCCQCRKEGRAEVAAAVDHITPKASGGTDDLSNLQALCDDHHKAKTAKEAAEARGFSAPRKKIARRIGKDGWPIE